MILPKTIGELNDHLRDSAAVDLGGMFLHNAVGVVVAQALGRSTTRAGSPPCKGPRRRSSQSNRRSRGHASTDALVQFGRP
jgi:hypothetical protein